MTLLVFSVTDEISNKEYTSFTSGFEAWIDEKYAKNEDARISCEQFVDSMTRIVAACLNTDGTVAAVDVAFPSIKLVDATRYLEEQLTGTGKLLIYEHDGVKDEFVPSTVAGLWLWKRSTIRSHIVGSSFIPSETV